MKRYGLEKKLITSKREPIYEITLKYIDPDFANNEIVDVGCGIGSFAKYLGKNIICLDQNPETIEFLKREKIGVPILMENEIIPLIDKSFQIVHCANVVEHLRDNEVYFLIKECDRILKPGGYLIIAGPYLNSYFYDNLSHIKPYTPEVFINYLIGENHDSRNRKIISKNYIVKELIYKYNYLLVREGYRFTNRYLDFLLLAMKKIGQKLGLRKFEKTGFLLILEKKV